jgi:hypothetical protein
MHERYVFAAFLPFLVACALLNSRVLWGVFVATVTVHFLNMYHVFSYYYLFNPETEGNYPSIIRLDFLNEWLQKNDAIGFPLPLLGTLSPVQILSMIFVLSFVVLVAAAYSMSERESPPPQQAAPQ